MLGLSATPNERNNKCDIISHLNIGKVLKADEIEGYKKDNTKFNASVTLIKYNGPDEYVNTHINETTKMICVPKIIEDIVNDPYRNQLIIDQLLELFNLKLSFKYLIINYNFHKFSLLNQKFYELIVCFHIKKILQNLY